MLRRMSAGSVIAGGAQARAVSRPSLSMGKQPWDPFSVCLQRGRTATTSTTAPSCIRTGTLLDGLSDSEPEL